MKLSIAMIVKNEENNLKATLEALSNINKKIESEIVIVDTGSTDNTINIAKQYTDRVYEHKWTGSFSEMRNISIKYCTGEWVLVLDADEVLNNPDELIDFLISEKGELFNSASVLIENYDRTSDEVTSEAYLTRLFRNSKDLKYTGRVHEQPVYKRPLAHTKISFSHYGYCADDYELMNYKFERNEKLLQEELKTAKGEYEIYVLFQLSKTYSMADRDAEALKYIKMAYNKEIKRKESSVHTFVYHWYANLLFNRKEYEKTIKICEQLEKYYQDNLDIFYMAAISYSSLGKFKEAYKYYDKYFKLRKRRELGEVGEDMSLSEGSFNNNYKMLANRIICYFREEKFNSVISEFEKCDNSKFDKSIENLYIYSCMSTDNIDKIIKYYEGKKFSDGDVSEIIVHLKRAIDEDCLKDINGAKKIFSKLDRRFKIYFDCTDDKCLDNAGEIEYSQYYEWKKEILKELVLADSNNLGLLINEKNEVIKAYVNGLCRSYKCIDIIYNYAKSKFLSLNLRELNLVCNLENVLVFNKSIINEKYKEMVMRILVNKSLFRKLVFNTKELSNDEIRIVLDEYNLLWFDMENELELYHKNKIDYVKKLGETIKQSSKYSSIIGIFKNEVNDAIISEEMIEEKNNILSLVENMIASNKIQEADDVILELEKVFKWDGKIFDYKGVINYLKEDYDNALLNLALAELFMEDKFDPIFNIACVMEKQDRTEDCIKYYKKAFELCGDEGMKEQIKEIIQGLK